MNKTKTEKLPCTTCPDICENVTSLYRSFLLLNDCAKVEKMRFQCPQTGLCYETDLSQE